MDTTIEIEGPYFYGQEDENIFFNCIYVLPNFKNVKGVGTKLFITLAADVTDEVLEKLLVICYRWKIDIANLKRFKNKSNSSMALWVQS